MDAPFLRAVFDSVYVLSLTCWVGAIAFFSFGVAPIIFSVLDAGSAARFVRALFPRYYQWGAVSGAVALPAFLGVPLSFPEFRGPMVALQSGLILAGTLIMLYCGNSLTPAINTARDAGRDQAERFDRLHRRSVRLNAAALLIGIGLLVGFAVRPAPRSAGLQELGPAERARYDAAFLNTMVDELQSLRDGGGTPGGAREVFPADSPERREIREMLSNRRRVPGAGNPPPSPSPPATP